MMGAGKSTVGQALARRRGWAFVDSDAQIEAQTGRTVAQIWHLDGEAAFRKLEAEVLADALAQERPTVVAAAGGVVLDAATRERLRGNGPVVWLRARPETLAGRVGSATHRPLLDTDPRGVLARLAAERAGLYAEVADATVDIDGLSADRVVERVEAALGALAPAGGGRDAPVRPIVDGALYRVTVDLGRRSYPVLVGPGARHRLLEVLPVGARRAAVVTQEAVGVAVGAGVAHNNIDN
jgi:shikimate kinase